MLLSFFPKHENRHISSVDSDEHSINFNFLKGNEDVSSVSTNSPLIFRFHPSSTFSFHATTNTSFRLLICLGEYPSIDFNSIFFL